MDADSAVSLLPADKVKVSHQVMGRPIVSSIPAALTATNRGRFKTTTITPPQQPGSGYLSGTNSAVWDCRIQSGQLHSVGDLAVEFQVTTASAVQLASVPQWFDVEVISPSDNSVIQELPGRQIRVTMDLAPDDEVKKRAFKEANIDPGTGLAPIEAALAGTRRYTLRMNSLFFDKASVWLSHQTQDLILRFRFAGASRSVLSGTAADVSLDQVRLICFERYHSAADQAAHERAYMSTAQSTTVCHFYTERITDKTYAASTKVELSVNNWDHTSQGIVFGFYTGTSPTADALQRPIDIGDEATVDLVSPSGVSLLASGVPLRAVYLKDLFQSQFPHAKAVGQRYLIPFGDVAGALVAGLRHGYFRFSQSNVRIAINQAPAAVAEVQAVTLANAANDSGSARFYVNGEVSAPVAFGANAATTAAALNAMQWAIKGGYTVTCSGGPAATFNCTIAGGNRSAWEQGYRIVLAGDLADGGVAETGGVASLTTMGAPGALVGSNYTAIVDSLGTRVITMDPQGNLGYSDLE